MLRQRDVTWPLPGAGVGTLTLQWPHHEEQVAFGFHQQIRDLLQAEEYLTLTKHLLVVTCKGIELPPWAFLQERCYQIQLIGEPTLGKGPVFLSHLGQEIWVWVPPTFSNQMLLKWCGVHEFTCLLDEHAQVLNPLAKVIIGGSIVVQHAAEQISLDLDLLAVGFGLDTAGVFGGLSFSPSFISTGLWELDQVVKSNALITWASSGYGPLTMWLPSLAEAIVEVWPGLIED